MAHDRHTDFIQATRSQVVYNARILIDHARADAGLVVEYDAPGNTTWDNFYPSRLRGTAESRWRAATHHAWESRMMYRLAEITETLYALRKSMPKDQREPETQTHEFILSWLNKVFFAAQRQLPDQPGTWTRYGANSPWLWGELDSDWNTAFPLIKLRKPFYPRRTKEDDLQIAAQLRLQELAGGPGGLLLRMMEGPDYRPNIFASDLISGYLTANREATNVDPFDRNRWGCDTRLGSLSLAHRGQPIKLTPTFDKDVSAYKAELPNGLTASDVIATAHDKVHSRFRPTVKVSITSGIVKIGVIAADRQTTGTVRIANDS